MSEFRHQPNPDTQTVLTREKVIAILESSKDRSVLEGVNIKDIDLSKLDLSHRSFRACDARGLIVEGSNITETDWTDASIEANGPYTSFHAVKAEGSIFGFSKILLADKAESGKNENLYRGFDGSSGNFQRCIWNNIDFQGESGYGAIFADADLSGSVFDGCDLQDLDWTTSTLDDIKIKIYDPDSLVGLIITPDQIPTLIRAVEFSNSEAYTEGMTDEQVKKSPAQFLESFFGVVVK